MMQDSQKVGPKTGQFTSIVALLMLSAVVLDIQFGILAPLVGVVTSEAQLSSSQMGWILNGMMLGGAVSIGLVTRLGDTYGHRKVLLIMTGLAIIGTLLAATVSGFWPLLIGRFLGGMAAGIPLSWGLLRPRATARQIQLTSLALTLVLAVATPLANVLGGLINHLGFAWQSIFWVVLGIFVLLFIFALIAPETPKSALSHSPVDWFGAAGLGIWVSALLIGISEGPSRGWSSPLVVGGFAVSFVVLVVWVIQQKRATAPIMSFKNMDVRQALVGYGSLLAAVFPSQGLFLVLPLFLQTSAESGFAPGLSALDSSFVLLALLPGSAVGYLWTRWGLEKIGPRLVLVISGIGGAALFTCFAFVNSPTWILYVWVFVYGITILSFLTVGFTLIAASGRQDNMAVTVGMQNIVQFVSSVIIVAVILNVLNPGPEGFIAQATFTGVFMAMAASILLAVILWAKFAPNRISDLHAVDNELHPDNFSPEDISVESVKNS